MTEKRAVLSHLILMSLGTDAWMACEVFDAFVGLIEGHMIHLPIIDYLLSWCQAQC